MNGSLFLRSLVCVLSCLHGKVFGADGFQCVETFTHLEIERPVALAIPPDGTRRLFLVQQRGQVRILPEDRTGTEAALFLDFSDRKMEANKFEEGLLGLAFHPDYKNNRKFYVYYSQQDPKRSVISELKAMATDPSRADPATERILMEIPQPYWNHNSGNLLFGPDGMLYICVGDGGKGDDAARLAQNLFALNGKVLRIDVNRTQGARAYGIPPDNPFATTEGARPEIFTLGMRNPWGTWCDPVDGTLWCADVGQIGFEEINLLRRGGNYGWSFREGLEAFYARKDPPPEDAVFVDPIHVYGRLDGLSITGGFRYRGHKHPSLKNRYIFGDWKFGTLWALAFDDEKKEATDIQTLRKVDPKDNTLQPTAICPDADGEILILDWNGRIWELAAIPPSTPGAR